MKRNCYQVAASYAVVCECLYFIDNVSGVLYVGVEDLKLCHEGDVFSFLLAFVCAVECYSCLLNFCICYEVRKSVLKLNLNRTPWR